jgi:acetyl esterase
MTQSPLIDTGAQALLALLASLGGKPPWETPPAVQRQAYRDRRRHTQPPLRPLPVVVDHSADGVPVRLYRPLPIEGAPALPVLLYFHGGGWVVGDLDTHDAVCRDLAHLAGIAVVAVDYRLAPEHPYPAAQDDALVALRWVRREHARLGILPHALAVGGDSAGGQLATLTARALRDAGEPPARHQLLIYPVTDRTLSTPSSRQNAVGYGLTTEGMAWYWGRYMGAAASAASAAAWDAASPMHAGPLAGLPPALILTAGFDPLRDEGRGYADALSRAGVPTQYVCFERQIHGFILSGRLIDEAHTAIALCAHALKQHLHGAG